MPEPRDDDPCEKLLCHMARGLKIAMIVSIYFSICVIILLMIIGARP